MLSGVAAATGEEIGWRGFLVPELAKVLPFTGVALVSGLIWAAWHYPIIAVVYRDAGLPPWFWLLKFTFVAVAISFAQAWLRLRTDSVWPPIFLHASHNLWIQSIFTPLTSDQHYTKWIAATSVWHSWSSPPSSPWRSGSSAASYRRNRLCRSRFSRVKPASPPALRGSVRTPGHMRPARPGCADHSCPRRPRRRPPARR